MRDTRVASVGRVLYVIKIMLLAHFVQEGFPIHFLYLHISCISYISMIGEK
jgi:hypothetical protein